MGQESHYTSANLGGIKRGDSEETGDLEAQPTETVDRAGSGSNDGQSGVTGHVTGDPSALASDGPAAVRGPMSLHGDSVLEELAVYDASDPTLGLTDIDEIPPDDWAADTGDTTSTEAEAPSHKY